MFSTFICNKIPFHCSIPTASPNVSEPCYNGNLRITPSTPE